MEKNFPEGMVPIGDSEFCFSCHEGVACFTRCCQKVDMFLFPYDIIRLKNAKSMDSNEFLRLYTRVVSGHNPYFPSVMLKLDENDNCPFLTESGCSVYKDRPSSCRTYPLERAVDRNPERGRPEEFYFMTDHDYCLGHKEERVFTTKKWVRNQGLDQYNTMNDLWGQIDTLFNQNPWRGEGAGGEKQRVAFMVCYDIDGFRKFVEDHKLISQYRLDKNTRGRIKKDDSELLKFGFEWLKTILAGSSSLIRK